MNRLSTFILGVVVGAGGLFVSENYYIVRGKDALYLVRKMAAKLEIPYHDVRNFTVDDWNNNPALGLAIVKSKKHHLLTESGLTELQNKFESLLNSFDG